MCPVYFTVFDFQYLVVSYTETVQYLLSKFILYDGCVFPDSW